MKKLIKLANKFSKYAMPTLTEDETFDKFNEEEKERITTAFNSYVREYEKLKDAGKLDKLKSKTIGGPEDLTIYDTLGLYSVFNNAIRKQPHRIGNSHFAVKRMNERMEEMPEYKTWEPMMDHLLDVVDVVTKRFLRWHHSVGGGARARMEEAKMISNIKKHRSIEDRLNRERDEILGNMGGDIEDD